MPLRTFGKEEHTFSSNVPLNGYVKVSLCNIEYIIMTHPIVAEVSHLPISLHQYGCNHGIFKTADSSLVSWMEFECFGFLPKQEVVFEYYFLRNFDVYTLSCMHPWEFTENHVDLVKVFSIKY